MGDKNVVKCKTCSGGHWTSMCPWKDTAMAEGKDEKKATEPSKPGGGNKYIPPNMPEGATRTRSDNPNSGRRDDTTAIRIANLSEDTTEQEFEELVKPYGPIHKLFLAKDESSQLCKGFGYIHFKFKNDAAKAMEKLNGVKHNHLILTVEWSKPQTHNNN